MRRASLAGPLIAALTACSGGRSLPATDGATPDSEAPAPDSAAADAPSSGAVGGGGDASAFLDGAVARDVGAVEMTADVAPADRSSDRAAVDGDAAGTPDARSPADAPAEGPLPGQLALIPQARDFGSVAVGTTSSLATFTVANRGGTAVGALIVAVNGASYGIPPSGNRCGPTVAAGARCTVDVFFHPDGRGQRTGTLVMSGDGLSATATLTGTGVLPAALLLSPTAQGFNAAPGAQSAPTTFSVSNGGEAATGPLTTALAGPNPADFVIVSDACGAGLTGGGRCTVQAAFRPTTEGVKTAALTVSGAPGITAMAVLTGSGSALAVDPPFADFGSLVVGATSAARVFTVTNRAAAATVPLHPTTSVSAFPITATGCEGVALPPSGSCTVSVAFRPDGGGLRTALLTVDPGTPAAAAAVIGVGIP
jgi:hypothetical protein